MPKVTKRRPSSHERSRSAPRVGVLFWFAVFALVWTTVEGALGSLLPVSPFILAAGFIGAFLGSSPLIAFPSVSRRILGDSAALSRPGGRALLMFVAALATALLAFTAFKHESWVGRLISEAGLLAAIAAGVWLEDMLPALRLWTRRKFQPPAPSGRDL